MSSSEADRVLLNQFFYNVQKAEGQADYQADRAGSLDRYAFSPDLRAAIEHDDIAAMYRAGANPYLLRFYCVNLGIAEPAYLQAMHAMRGADPPVPLPNPVRKDHVAEIVAAFAACHAPPLIQRPDAVSDAFRERVFGLYREMGRRLAEAHPQALVVLTNEHLHNFSLANFPAVCIGLAQEYPGPAELWLKLEPQLRKGEPSLAEYLYRAALDADFDPSVSYGLALDHGTLTPLHLADVDPELPIVPIFFNNVEPPLPTMRRCLQWGQFIGRTLRDYAGLERVAVLGTGGLSHDIGTPTMGAIDEAFDREFLRLLASQDPGPLIRFAQDHVHEAGNGAEEIRNWIATRGVVGDAPLDVLIYEPVPEWYIGLGIAQWQVRPPLSSGS